MLPYVPQFTGRPPVAKNCPASDVSSAEVALQKGQFYCPKHDRLREAGFPVRRPRSWYQWVHLGGREAVGSVSWQRAVGRGCGTCMGPCASETLNAFPQRSKGAAVGLSESL